MENQQLSEILELWRENVQFYEYQIALKGSEDVELHNKLKFAKRRIQELQERIKDNTVIADSEWQTLIPLLTDISRKVHEMDGRLFKMEKRVVKIERRVFPNAKTITFVLIAIFLILLASPLGHWSYADLRGIYLSSPRGMALGIAVSIVMVIQAALLVWATHNDDDD